MQLTKCVVWSLQMLYHFTSLPHGFLTLDSSLYIFGTLVRSTSFVESFVAKALYEYLGMIFSIPKPVDP